MSPQGDATFDAIEFRQIEDILDCQPGSGAVLLTQAAVDGPDDELVAFNRDVVNQVLDRVDDISEVALDALRSYYVDLYGALIPVGGLSAYRAFANRQVNELVLQGLKLMDVPAHLDLLVDALSGDGISDEQYAARFAEAEAARPLTEANAAFLRSLDTIQIVLPGSFDVALRIALGKDGDDFGSIDLPRWRGNVEEIIKVN